MILSLRFIEIELSGKVGYCDFTAPVGYFLSSARMYRAPDAYGDWIYGIELV